MNARRARVAPLTGILLLLTGAACSTRSLRDLSFARGGDAATASEAAPAEAASSGAEAPPAAIDAATAPDARPATDHDAVAPVDGAPAEADAAPAADAAPPLPRVALLVGQSPLGTADAAIAQRLAALGLAPDVHDDSVVAALDLSTVALVFVSATVDSPKVGTALRTLGRPVIVSEPFLFDDFAMTEAATGTDPRGVDSDQTTLHILTPAHPLAGGARGQVVVAGQPVRLNWGIPPKNALAIAHLADPTHLALFAYEAGAAMVALPAPARRVGFFLDLRTANELTPAGWALFDAAVTWAVSR